MQFTRKVLVPAMLLSSFLLACEGKTKTKIEYVENTKTAEELKAANDRIALLEKGPTQSQLEALQQTYDETKAELEALKDKEDPRIAELTGALEQAQAAIENLEKRPTQEELTTVQSELEQVRRDVVQLKADLETAQSQTLDGVIKEQEATVEELRNAVAQSEQAYTAAEKALKEAQDKAETAAPGIREAVGAFWTAVDVSKAAEKGKFDAMSAAADAENAVASQRKVIAAYTSILTQCNQEGVVNDEVAYNSCVNFAANLSEGKVQRPALDADTATKLAAVHSAKDWTRETLPALEGVLQQLLQARDTARATEGKAFADYNLALVDLASKKELLEKAASTSEQNRAAIETAQQAFEGAAAAKSQAHEALQTNQQWLDTLKAAKEVADLILAAKTAQSTAL